MSRMAKVELAVSMDLEKPLEVVQAARELQAVLTVRQWEAMVLLASAVIEEAAPGMVLRLAEAVKRRADLVGH